MNPYVTIKIKYSLESSLKKNQLVDDLHIFINASLEH